MIKSEYADHSYNAPTVPISSLASANGCCHERVRKKRYLHYKNIWEQMFTENVPDEFVLRLSYFALIKSWGIINLLYCCCHFKQLWLRLFSATEFLYAMTHVFTLTTQSEVYVSSRFPVGMTYTRIPGANSCSCYFPPFNYSCA